MKVSRQVRRAEERAARKGMPAVKRHPSSFKSVEIPLHEVEAFLEEDIGAHPRRYPKHGIDNDLEPTKGQIHGGECNRTACDRHGAVWWNRETFAFYCQADALAINRGHNNPLCVPLKAKPEVETMEALRTMSISA